MPIETYNSLTDRYTSKIYIYIITASVDSVHTLRPRIIQNYVTSAEFTIANIGNFSFYSSCVRANYHICVIIIATICDNCVEEEHHSTYVGRGRFMETHDATHGPSPPVHRFNDLFESFGGHLWDLNGWCGCHEL